MGKLKAVVVVLVSALASGCSVASWLTYDELAAELDGITEVKGTGLDQRVEYATRAAVSTWYMRSLLLLPLRGLLGGTLGPREMRDLENPSKHVRQLLRALPYQAGSASDRVSDAVVRLLLLAELDPSPANRIVALDGACRLLDSLGVTGLPGPLEEFGMPASAAAIEAARATVQRWRPEARVAGEFDQAGRESYRLALAALSERPLPQWGDRLDVLGDLHACWQAESDPVLRLSAQAAWRDAVRHAVHGALVRAVQSREPRQATVRLCAMQALRRLGGPAAVPLLLALMADPAAGTTRLAERFDQDPLVQLRLIHLCGQLRGELANRAIRLPGREEWDAISPVDFLARTVLGEQDYYSKLRVPALTALCLSLGKPRLDYDVEWVEAWYREQQLGS